MPETNKKPAPAVKKVKKSPAPKKELKTKVAPVVKPAPVEEAIPAVEIVESAPLVVEEIKEPEAVIDDAPIVVTESPVPAAPVNADASTVVNPVPLFRDRIENFDAYVEEKRVPFYKDFFKIKLVSYILMGICLALVIALFILVFTLKESDLNWIIYVLLVVVIAVLVGNMIFSKLTTKKNEKKFKGYVFGFLHNIQEACYQDSELQNAVVDVEGKIDNENVYNAHVYSTINRIESRSVVKGTLYGHNFVSADIALTIPPVSNGQKVTRGKSNEVFAVYGRAFNYGFALPAEKSIIVIRKAANTIMPDHTLSYKEIKIAGLADDFVVLTTDEATATALFSAELIAKLNELTPNDNLFDYIISLNSTGTYIYTNYNDNYMVVPTNKGHSADCYKNIIEDNAKILAVLKLLK